MENWRSLEKTDGERELLRRSLRQSGQHLGMHSRSSSHNTCGPTMMTSPVALDLESEVLTTLHKRDNSQSLENFYSGSVYGTNSNLIGVTLLQEPQFEPVVEGPDRVSWEYHSVNLTRVPGYGYGIAVSGGRDNPHFANGDPAIAISDVLKAGPAEGKLQVNDRILSANGISLENVEYATAVQVLRDSGPNVQLVVKRRVVLSPETSTFRVSLSKGKKKDDYGFQLGCKIYIKEVGSRALESQLAEGDVILKINGNSCEGLSLKEARKLVDGSKDRLSLLIRRDKRGNNNNNGPVPTTSTSNNVQPQPVRNEDFGDASGNNYSSQNLYVQPPTRGATNGPNPPPRFVGGSSEKNNLFKSRSFEDPASPAPPRPPPPREEVETHSTHSLGSVNGIGSPKFQKGLNGFPEPSMKSLGYSHEGIYFRSEPRTVSFHKEGSVGIRLAGGNEVGIFVAAIQPGSPAEAQGLQPGDKILKVNHVDLGGSTREEAVLLLLSISQIELRVEFRPEEYEVVMRQNLGDSFYIMTHFHYESPKKNELPFRSKTVFNVVDTLWNGTVGAWQVLLPNGTRAIIPNKARAEELATLHFNEHKQAERSNSIFRRRRGSQRRRVESDIEDAPAKFPAYERVTLKGIGFLRPVVLFGAVADVGRERLLRDFGDKFVAMESRVLKVREIKEIKNRHALLDVNPQAVEKLSLHGLHPIVVFLKVEKSVAKEIRASVLGKGGHSLLRKSSRKLVDEAEKLENNHSHLFTSILPVPSPDSWYRKLRETIDREQAKTVWASENNNKQEEAGEDLIFPMVSSSRYSYASSPDQSDLENGADPQASMHNDQDSVQLPNYTAPPPYSVTGYKQDIFPARIAKSPESKYGFVTSLKPPETPRKNPPLAHSPPDSPLTNPPKVDRSKKPKTATERLFGESNYMNGDSFNYSMNSILGRGESDPYRFTRSTAQPMYNSPYKSVPHHESNGRAPLPAKQKPVPPPKPKTTGEGNYYLNVPIKVHTTPQKIAHHEESSAFVSYRNSNNSSGLGDSSSMELYQRPKFREARGVFSSEGGRLADGGISLRIPKGALKRPTEIFFKVVEPKGDVVPLEGEEKLLSPVVLFGPNDLKFKVPVEVTLPHDTANAHNLSLKSKNAGEWENFDVERLEGSNSLTFYVDHF